MKRGWSSGLWHFESLAGKSTLRLWTFQFWTETSTSCSVAQKTVFPSYICSKKEKKIVFSLNKTKEHLNKIFFQLYWKCREEYFHPWSRTNGFLLSRMRQIDILFFNITESSEKEMSCSHTEQKEGKCCWPKCYGELQNVREVSEEYLWENYLDLQLVKTGTNAEQCHPDKLVA